MSTARTSSRERYLARLISRADRLLRRGRHASSLFTRWRLGIFVVGLIVTVSLYRLGRYEVGNAALAFFIGLFAVVAAYHNRLERRIHRLALWQGIKQVHLARLRLDWPSIPYRHSFAPEQHPYARDLDIVGRHSLLHLVDTSVSSGGRQRLADWFLVQPPPPDVWRDRQALAAELSRRPLFRDRLALEARLIGEEELNGQRLAAALHHRVGVPRLTLVLGVQASLAAVTAALVTAALLGWLPNYWMFSFGAYAFVYFMTDQGEHLLEHAVGLHFELEKLGAVLAYLERHAGGRASWLARCCGPLLASASKPSRLIRRTARVFHAISVKAHPLIHLALNALVPWDLWFTRRLLRIQDRIGDLLPVWLDRLAEVEAAAAIGALAHLHPAWTWPRPDQEAARANGTAARVSALALGHPLIPAGRRVANDLSLVGLGRIHLVTGSNMSGKSTFLRTVGINVCLAQAGAPVCADRFEWTRVRLMCCIRVDDSLEAGLSFFYAEVKRLKSILDATRLRSGPPVLFLIDEIFKGTNNRERLIGSRAYIAAIAEGHGFGLVTTHDLELTDLDKTIPAVSNAHFQETVTAGALEFDYRLRQGPCPTTNALRIMALEGLPIPKEDRGT